MQRWTVSALARLSRVEVRAAHGSPVRVAFGGFGDPRTRGLIALGAVLASAAAGAIATQPRLLLASLGALGVTLAAFLSIRARGVLLGLLLIAVANAIPGVNLDDAVAPGGLPLQDIAILLIIGLLAQRVIGGEPERLRRPWVGPAMGWGCVLAAWWIFTWLRSIGGEGISPLNAALFGRDFLYFALLVPLALAGLDLSDLAGLAAVVVAGGRSRRRPDRHRHRRRPAVLPHQRSLRQDRRRDSSDLFVGQ
jgi:hypothetical protein